MENEAWLNGTLTGFAPHLMPAAHALTQAAKDLNKVALDLNNQQLLARPNSAPSIAFHLRHIAGSIDRLLTYARAEQLTDRQFAELKAETALDSDESARELTEKAVRKIAEVLDALKNTPPEILFEARFVGRKKLPTNVFGLLFHIAEHTARHVGQITTTAQIVANGAGTSG